LAGHAKGGEKMVLASIKGRGKNGVGSHNGLFWEQALSIKEGEILRFLPPHLSSPRKGERE